MLSAPRRPTLCPIHSPQVPSSETRRPPRGHGVCSLASFAEADVVLCFERYVLLDGWKPESKYHQELMALHLRGNGCAKTPTISEDLEFFRKVLKRASESLPITAHSLAVKAGFVVKEHFDFMAYGDKL